jgi:hypothetical protein
MKTENNTKAECPICTATSHQDNNKNCIFCKGSGKVEIITNIKNFLKMIEEENDPNFEKYYRGESKYYENTSLQPSIARKYKHTHDNAIKDEHILFREIISKCPKDFQGMNSTFEKLVKMQHYFLPTRLLDITLSPLIALYFACEQNHREDGIVYIFEINKQYIKFFDSDTISIISNLSKIKKELLVSKEKFENSEQYNKLLVQIHQEKANFEDRIKVSDLYSIQCVVPKYDNERIKAQSGAFFIFGIDKTTPHKAIANIYNNDQIKVKGLLIDKLYKEKILEELERLNIHKASLFPEIDSVSKYITDKYARTNKIMDDTKNSAQKATEESYEEIFEKSTNTSSRNKEENKYHEFLLCNKILDNKKVQAKFHFPEYATLEKQKEFIKLFFGSFSLSFEEKKKVLDSLETLSEFQFDALIEVFYEENEKFYSLFKEHPNDIVMLSIQAVETWHKLIYDGKDLKNYLENFFSCTLYNNENFKNSFYIHLLNLILKNA